MSFFEVLTVGTGCQEIVHYLDIVERPETEEEGIEEWEKRNVFYTKISKTVKERFAHRYAELLLVKLKAQDLIPFEKID